MVLSQHYSVAPRTVWQNDIELRRRDRALAVQLQRKPKIVILGQNPASFLISCSPYELLVSLLVENESGTEFLKHNSMSPAQSAYALSKLRGE